MSMKTSAIPKSLIYVYFDEYLYKVEEVEQDGVVELAKLLLPVNVLAWQQLLDSLRQIRTLIINLNF